MGEIEYRLESDDFSEEESPGASSFCLIGCYLTMSVGGRSETK